MNKTMKKLIVMSVDIIIIYAGIILAIYLRFDFRFPKNTMDYVNGIFPFSVGIALFIGLLLGSYSKILSYFGFDDLLKQLFSASAIGLGLISLKVWGIRDISGSITVIFCILYFIGTSGVRGIPRFKRWINSKQGAVLGNSHRVLIVGGGIAGAMVVKQLLDLPMNNRYPVGVVDDDFSKQRRSISGVKVVGNIAAAAEMAEKLNVDEIIIAIPTATEEELKKIFKQVAKANLPTKIYQNAMELDSYQKSLDQGLREVSVEELLFRAPIQIKQDKIREFMKEKVVLVTGGAGSIGSELCRQVLENGAKTLIIFDMNENGLYEINEELKEKYEGKYITCIGSVREEERLDYVFKKYEPQVVIHAAAHKHVPMMEINPFEAVKNNVYGTLNLVKKTREYTVQKFILISTDKAVNPTNVMGATKRICELIIKAYGVRSKNEGLITEFMAVRFGNVLGSNGSVIPLFKKQIAAGGPVTITDKEMTRYFMTIKEAVTLVLSASTFAKGSELFVLDMGQPVKIYDLAISLISATGKKPYEDIDIKITGLRPGEKMFEELNLENENVDKTTHPKIFIMKEHKELDVVEQNRILEKIDEVINIAMKQESEVELREVLFELIR